MRAGGPLLVLCTYDSSPVLAEAMGAVPDFCFDVAIADEAHRCAGLETTRHKTILDADAIRAGRRLFFTATPTVYGTRDKSRAANKNVRLASMDDHSRFGPIIHHLSFAQAIHQGLLCPYQVAVIPIDDDEVHELIKRRRIVTADGDHSLEAAALATQIACARAMRRFGCRRIVAFHPTDRRLEALQRALPDRGGTARRRRSSTTANLVRARRRRRDAACHAHEAARLAFRLRHPRSIGCCRT